MSAPAARLPKTIEADPVADGLLELLADRARPLWAGAAIGVASLVAQDGVTTSLRSACRAGFVVRGLEAAERRLAEEERGLKLAVGQEAGEGGVRISRLLVVTDDGAERFYRNVEGLLRRHSPRLYAVRLEIDEHAFGELLYGAGRVARLALLVHKNSVADFLLAVARQCRAEDGPD